MLRKMRGFLLWVGFCFVFLQGLTAFAVTNQLAQEPYIHEEEGFQLLPPLGWEVDESRQFGALVVFLNPEIDNEVFKANANVTVESAPGVSLKAYVKAGKKALANLFQNYRLVEDKGMMVQGKPAHLLGSTFTQGKLKLKNRQLILLSDGKAYVLTVTALTPTWRKYVGLFDQVMASFRLR